MDFLKQTQKAQTIKEKINTFDYIKIENFCLAKDTINTFRRQVADYDSTLATYVADEGVVSKETNNSYKCKEKTIWKCCQMRSRQFTGEDTQTVKRIIKDPQTPSNYGK